MTQWATGGDWNVGGGPLEIRAERTPNSAELFENCSKGKRGLARFCRILID